MGQDIYVRFKRANSTQSLSVSQESRAHSSIENSGSEFVSLLEELSNKLNWVESLLESYDFSSRDHEEDTEEGVDFEIETTDSVLVVDTSFGFKKSCKDCDFNFTGFQKKEVALAASQVFKMSVFYGGETYFENGVEKQVSELPLDFRKMFLGYQSQIIPMTYKWIEEKFSFLRWENFNYGNDPNRDYYFGLGKTTLITTHGTELRYAIHRSELNVWEEDGQMFIFFESKFRFMLGVGVKLNLFDHAIYKVAETNVPFECQKAQWIKDNNLIQLRDMFIDTNRDVVFFNYKVD